MLTHEQELRTVIKAIQKSLPGFPNNEFATCCKVKKSLQSAGAQMVVGINAPPIRYYNTYFKRELNGILDLNAVLNNVTFAIEVRTSRYLAGCRSVMTKLCLAPHDYSMFVWGYEYYRKPERILKYKDGGKPVMLVTYRESWLVSDKLYLIQA